MITEIKSFWLGEGIELEMRLHSLYDEILNHFFDKEPDKILQSVKQLAVFCSLLKCFISQESNKDQEVIIKVTESFCLKNSVPIHLILQQLYQGEVLSEEALVQWGREKK